MILELPDGTDVDLSYYELVDDDLIYLSPNEDKPLIIVDKTAEITFTNHDVDSDGVSAQYNGAVKMEIDNLYGLRDDVNLVLVWSFLKYSTFYNFEIFEKRHFPSQKVVFFSGTKFRAH